MNSIDFHNQLNYLSNAVDPSDLAERILGIVIPGKRKLLSPENESLARQVNHAFEAFLTNNKSLAEFDIPALERLKLLAKTFTIWIKTENAKNQSYDMENLEEVVNYHFPSHKKAKYLSSEEEKTSVPNRINITSDKFENIESMSLEKIVEEAIKTAQDKSDLLILPPVLHNLCDEYCSMEELIYAAIAGRNPSPETLSFSIASACNNDRELTDFIKNTRLRYISTPHISEKMIYTFFQHASLKAQNLFFNKLYRHHIYIQKSDNDENYADVGDESAFLMHVISALPDNLTHLNLVEMVTSIHVKKIVERFNHLESLIFENAYSLNDNDVEIIADSPKMASLRSLRFHFASEISIVGSLKAQNSPNLTNLQDLKFIMCVNAKRKFVSQ